MRQRQVTAMNAKSSEFDVFMSMPSREALQFVRAGWLADLMPFVKNPAATSKEYQFSDFSALIAAATFGGKLTSVPLNIESPVLYYRTDVFKKCGVSLPARLDGLPTLLAKLKTCEPSMVPLTTRGLKSALPYTYSAVLHNFGGDYLDKSRKPALCSKEAQAATAFYAALLKDFGPPGPSITPIIRTVRCTAMAGRRWILKPPTN